MAIAIALILIVIGSVIFHFWSPWSLAPLASNWGSIDVTILITLIITAVVFIAVNLFMALAIIRFRHKKGRKAKYEPENKKLEVWLTVLTSVGIAAMLAPGLIVYAEFVNAPANAMKLEIVGQQWSWSFRFPGLDGQLGKSDIRHISVDNPFGLDPMDEAAQDDVLVQDNRLYLPVDQPVKMLMRSKDVLHDFYVPQFRVKMDMVPGVMSSIWLTPTVLGEFEILCAEFCGLGHFNMRGYVQVVEGDEFDTWLAKQSTFNDAVAQRSAQQLSVAAMSGQQVTQDKGCMACHDFSNSALGPSWLGLFGKTQSLSDGTEIIVDEAYLRESILAPEAKLVAGFAPIMPTIVLSELELQAVIAFIKERGKEQSNLSQGGSLSGKDLAQTKGCTACHSQDGTSMLGPSWQGLFGKTQNFVNGGSILVDESYLREAIEQPNARVVAGFPPVMPQVKLSETELQALINFIKTL